MTKSRRLPTKNKKKTLAERIEALENQSFAQQLLIDELEKKLDELEKKLEQVEERNLWNQPIQQPPQQQWNPYHGHTCTSGMPDIFGNITCTTCGKWMSGNYTVTSDTLPTDDIDIMWVVPNDTTRSG